MRSFKVLIFCAAAVLLTGAAHIVLADGTEPGHTAARSTAVYEVFEPARVSEDGTICQLPLQRIDVAGEKPFALEYRVRRGTEREWENIRECATTPVGTRFERPVRT